MKFKQRKQNLLMTGLTFLAMSIVSALLDHDWLEKTTSSAKTVFGWVVGGLFGAAILTYIGKGMLSLWRIMTIRFCIARGEQIALLTFTVVGMVYFALTGFIDSSAGLAAALLLSALLAIAFFWLWRVLRDIVNRVLHGDRFCNLSNLEYFSLIFAAFVISFGIVAQEPGMMLAENLRYSVPAVFLLIIAAGVILYWSYIAIKTMIRKKKYHGKLMEYSERDLLYFGATRTVQIPLDSITRVEKVETYSGLSAIPTLYSHARTSEMLSLHFSDCETILLISWPGADEANELCRRSSIHCEFQ